MPRLILAVTLTLMVAVQISGAEQQKILFIGKEPDHPYGSHMYLHTCEVLSKCLAQIDGVSTAISSGWPKDAEVLDEYYLNPKLTPAAQPLLQVTVNDHPVTVGWTFERDNQGRSVGITLGHFYRNFQLLEFRRMIVNSICWAAHIDVPGAGANVDLTESELALPTQPH